MIPVVCSDSAGGWHALGRNENRPEEYDACISPFTHCEISTQSDFKVESAILSVELRHTPSQPAESPKSAQAKFAIGCLCSTNFYRRFRIEM